VGAAEDAISVSYTTQCALISVAGSNCRFGIGLDNTAAFAVSPFVGWTPANSTALAGGSVSYQFMTGLGTHTISANEQGDGSHANTFNSNLNGILTAAIRM